MNREHDQYDEEEMPPAGADPQNPTAELLLWAYRNAVFPMADPDTGTIDWYSPDPRGILPLTPTEDFHVPKNLARLVRQKHFIIRSDTAFEDVIHACDTPRTAVNRSWLNEHMISAYVELHRQGNAHSVEAWLDGQLVGGLYGVHIGAAFFGESMFVRPDLGGTNASKVCLVHLVKWLRHRGFILLDTQFWNPHLDQFGCQEISADEYWSILKRAISKETEWGELKSIP